jgi:hypothetical protein
MWFISGDVQLQQAWEIMRNWRDTLKSHPYNKQSLFIMGDNEDDRRTLETHAHSVPKMNNYPAKNAVFTGSNGNKYKKKWCLL